MLLVSHWPRLLVLDRQCSAAALLVPVMRCLPLEVSEPRRTTFPFGLAPTSHPDTTFLPSEGHTRNRRSHNRLPHLSLGTLTLAGVEVHHSPLVLYILLAGGVVVVAIT